MNNPKVIVTRRWPEAVERKLREMCPQVQLNEEDQAMGKDGLKAALCEADCVLPTVTDPLGQDVLAVKGRLCKFLGNFGVGFNHIDVAAAKELGIVVTNTPEVLTDCTADTAMLLMLMVARRGGEGERHVRERAWTGWRPTHMMGTKVTGKTLGLVGFGRIAVAVAQKAHFGFGMKIIYHDPFYAGDPDVPKRLGAEVCDSLSDLLGDSDFVSLHCPGGDATHHLISEQELQSMKPEAFLINTARGDVVDNNSLIAALKSGTIRGAGLDVYEGEPDLDERFGSLENAVLLPHLGSATHETRNAMGMRVLENLRAWLDGKRPRDQIT